MTEATANLPTERPPSPPRKDAARGAEDGLALFGVVGLGLVLVAVGGVVAVLSGDKGKIKRVPFVLLGTALPVLSLLLAYGGGLLGPERYRRIARWLLGILGAGLFAALIVCFFNVCALILAATQWLLTSAYSRRAGALVGEGCPTVSAPVRRVGSFLVMAAAWTALIQLLRLRSGEWYNAFQWGSQSQATEWLLGSIYSIPVLVVCFLLVFWNLYPARPVSSTARLRFSRLGNAGANVFALAVLAALSFRTDPLFVSYGDVAFDTYHHWTYFIGPAEDLRHGGWLLWDVPSWYGFLNVALLAALPTASVWESMYLVNSFALFLSAAFVFLLFRALRPGLLNWLFALGVTTACVFLLPGKTDDLTGPQIWPASAAFRFLWVYVLLAVLIWDSRRAAQGKSCRIVGWLGCAAWVAAVLWSLESAVYSTFIWIPSYAALVWRDTTGPENAGLARARSVLAGLLFPLLLLALALAALAAYYRLVLGTFPDGAAFYEVALAFNGHYRGWFSDWVGPVIWFLVFCSVTTGALALLNSRPPYVRVLVWANWLALWATASYYVMKTNELMFFCEAPFLAIAVALTLHIGTQATQSRREIAWPQMVFLPLLTVLLAIPLANLPRLMDTIRGTRVSYHLLAERLPEFDEPTLMFLKSAGVQPGEPLIYFDNPWLGFSPRTNDKENGWYPRPWLPVSSWVKMAEWLPPMDARLQTYMRRFTDRHERSGYVLVKKRTKANPTWSWFFGQLTQTHTPTTVCESPEYELIWYEARRSSP